MTRIIGGYSIPDISPGDYPALVHDHNLAVIQNGSIQNYIHLERISRKKYDASYSRHIDEHARNLALIPANDTVFVFADHEIGRGFFSASGQIRLEANWSKGLKNTLEPARLYWFGEWPEAYVINHELAHLYSCIPFYGMFKENSLLVHFDGGASQSNFSAWTYKNGKIKLKEAHYKLKWLSGLFNANALVFSIIGAKKSEQNAVPGKFMGLEAFGNYRVEIEKWLKEEDFFKDCWASKKELFKSIKDNFGLEFRHIDNRNEFFRDIAATIHAVFIRESLNVFEQLKKETGAAYLYYAGGTALNIKLNRSLLLTRWFKEVYIPPCTNDSGLAIGAAVAGALHKNHKLENCSPYLNNFRLNAKTFEYSEKDIKEVANEIVKGRVLAICNGFGEAGPRALGNRSIIARADDTNLARKISREYKKREWYRPIAPVVLERNLYQLTGELEAPEIAKFMLTEFSISDVAKPAISGCVHSDGTARIQVIKTKDFNPYLYALLDYLDREYQLKALINTSFNQQGEPIVHTVNDARKSAEAMNLDGLIVNGKLEKVRP